jgi:hypothetical protein
MQLQVKESSNPWPVTLAKLESLEYEIQDTNKEGILKRWEFGRELLKRRVPNKVNKSQLSVPPALMALTVKQCGISQTEITKRIKFAERYPTKQDASRAILAFPSWTQMKNSFTKKKRAVKPRAKQQSLPSHHSPMDWTLGRLKQEVAKAWQHNATLTRDQVKDVEELHQLLTNLLNQIDKNDNAKAERKIS